MNNPKVISVNISEKKGTIKHPVEKITITEAGVMEDAHAGDWHRQVSLLAIESIEKFSKEAKPNDRIVYVPKVFRVFIITLSDRASGGMYQDRSGPKIREILNSFFSARN